MTSGYFVFRKSWRILSVIISAIMIVSITLPFNTSTAYALDIPVPLYPVNFADTTPDTDPPLGIPSFVWSVVSGASKYRLQLDSEIGFNSPIVVNIETYNTSYSLSSILIADGEWYWRVRVETPTPVGEWSEIMRFTKTWATSENRPTLLAPDEDAFVAFFNAPDFSWTPVIGAARYRFQIASSPDGFNAPIVSYYTLTPSTQPEGRLENGEYWWRVLPMDESDHLGTASEIRKFSMSYGTYVTNFVPTQLTPEDETFPTFTPTFHWTAVEGAEKYRLQYTSDESCDFNVGTSIETRQTSYSPTDTFPNDVRYCWHVRVESGSAVGDWSDTWHFQKQWDLKPQLLTPTIGYSIGLYPIYSWTPVPGASRYRIDIDNDAGFSSPIFESKVTANTTYSPQDKYWGTQHYYWRVTPIDGGGELGLTSDVAEFQSYYNSTAPILVYPLYYYPPNDPIYYGNEFPMNPVEDRTVAYPIFIWHRVMVPTPTGGVFATAYRIQVDTTPYFNNILWEYDTENTSATPIDGDDFSPLAGQDYFWHVCVLDYIGGNCITGQYSGWSQTWRTRFDPSFDPVDPNRWVLPPTQGGTPELLRPANGQEVVEATPLLEWWPFLDTSLTQYQVEISRDSDFSNIEVSETVNTPAYSPSYSIAQRSLGRTDYGTFYWHVRGFDGNGWSEWSDAWRFQIASQSEWRYIRSLGDLSNRLQIGADSVGDVSETYDLSALYATQQGGYPPDGIPAYWFLGFNASFTTPDMTYGIYLDLDHMDGSGAPTPPPAPRNYSVTTIPAHQPEYAIFVDKIGGFINAQNTWVYAWNGTNWGFGQRLSDIGGFAYASDGYVELQLLNGTIGMSQVTSSASVMLFSVNSSTGELEDSVPSDVQVPGNAQLSQFSAVSERMNLISTPNTVSGDPRTVPSLLPFFWDWPTGSDPDSPWAGSKLQVHLDPSYTNMVAEFHINSTDPYFGENNVVIMDDIVGDNIYYWRVQPRYLVVGSDPIMGAWSDGWSFRRLGFTAQNLQTSVNWATPTFSWDMVEGASTYRLQVSTDPNFGTTVINQVTPLVSYTPTGTLDQGTYYWRVQVIRYNNIGNDWSEVVQFNLGLPLPTGLTPDQAIVHYAPTLCWDPLVKYNEAEPYEPILSAWKYKVQVSRDENFSDIYDSITTNNNCWTPTNGYLDGAYWWHVAMIDGKAKLGPNSPAATFTKQYPVTTLVSPVGGSVPGTPTFIWTPVYGAAKYVFEVSKYSSFSPTYDSIVTVNTQFTPTKTYASNMIYYWRVAIRDYKDRQGPFTDAIILIGVGNYTYLPLIGR